MTHNSLLDYDSHRIYLSVLASFFFLIHSCSSCSANKMQIRSANTLKCCVACRVRGSCPRTIRKVHVKTKGDL
uniref:Uncharacterized protein n=1 Tax=Caenorhabditis japonica TaxID=281687 RepID=A0A8R1IK65_CAEJA